MSKEKEALIKAAKKMAALIKAAKNMKEELVTEEDVEGEGERE